MLQHQKILGNNKIKSCGFALKNCELKMSEENRLKVLRIPYCEKNC